MARNEDRRAALADAAITVLAREGARGLTHRAVDTTAGVPTGTASNYFRTRAALLEGLLARIWERLAPDPEVLAELGARRPSRVLFHDYIRDLVRRLRSNRDVTLALFELRLESARRPEVADIMGDRLRSSFADDIAFNESAGLPGGPTEIALFHYALDGLLLDRLTTPIDPLLTTDQAVEVLVDRLLPRRR